LERPLRVPVEPEHAMRINAAQLRIHQVLGDLGGD
jgi:hypothetical protein